MRTSKPFCLFIVLLLLVSGCKPRAAGLNCPPLPVGILAASADTPEGQTQRLGYTFALQTLAADPSACPLTPIYAEELTDSLSSSQNALLNLSDQNVLAIIGATSNEASMQAAAITHNLEIPLLIPSLTADEINKTDNAWIFRMSTSNEAEAELGAELIRSQLNEKARVAILYENSAFGENAAVYAAEAMLAANLQLVYYEKYAVSSVSLAAQLKDIADTKAEVLYFISNNPGTAQALLDSLSAEKAAAALQVITAGNGFTSSNFLKDLGNRRTAAENLIILAAWNADLPFKLLPDYREAYTAFAAQHPEALAEQPSLRFSEAYASMVFLSQSVNLALNDPAVDWWSKALQQTTNIPLFRDTLRQALRSQSNRPESILGTINLDAAGQNQNKPIALQIISGNLVTVYPPEWAQGRMRFQRNW